MDSSNDKAYVRFQLYDAQGDKHPSTNGPDPRQLDVRNCGADRSWKYRGLQWVKMSAAMDHNKGGAEGSIIKCQSFVLKSIVRIE